MDKIEKAATIYGSQSCLYPHCTVAVPLQSYGLHLNICRRKWRGPIAVCPYNNVHRFGEPERVFHLHVCPDKPANKRLASIKKQGDSIQINRNEKIEDVALMLKDKAKDKEIILVKNSRKVPSFHKPEDLMNTVNN